jgi:hypothetical protein
VSTSAEFTAATEAPVGISITAGQPTAEEIAVLSAVFSALASQGATTTAPAETETRGGRIRRRRELSGHSLPWKVGRS